MMLKITLISDVDEDEDENIVQPVESSDKRNKKETNLQKRKLEKGSKDREFIKKLGWKKNQRIKKEGFCLLHSSFIFLFGALFAFCLFFPFLFTILTIPSALTYT